MFLVGAYSFATDIVYPKPCQKGGLPDLVKIKKQ